MSAPTPDELRLVTEILTQKPFECDGVFFFALREHRPTPMDSDSKKLYEHYRDIIDALPRGEPIEGWPGNIVAGPAEGERVRFYASYRFEDTLLVVSKAIKVDPGQTHLPSPFVTIQVSRASRRG